jgi:hypothetical protein
MTPTDQKLFFTALGFLAVVLKETPQDKQAQRAAVMAGLIEAFCKATVPEAFGDDRTDDLAVQQRMAYVIASLIKVHGKCKPYDLRDHGFRQDEIACYWNMAYALASVTLNIEPKDS